MDAGYGTDADLRIASTSRRSADSRSAETEATLKAHLFECHEATDVVDEVLQSDLCSNSDDSDRPHDPAARFAPLRSSRVAARCADVDAAVEAP